MNIKKKIIRKILILIIFVVVCIVSSLNTGKIKEYDYQNIMLSYDDEGINRIKENDELTKNCVMSYDEYSSYCLRYNIAQKYNDESKYYAVYSFWFKRMCDYEIKSIKQIDKKIVINSKSSNFGPVADYTIIFIIQPKKTPTSKRSVGGAMNLLLISSLVLIRIIEISFSINSDFFLFLYKIIVFFLIL